jgi:hypothetical protein
MNGQSQETMFRAYGLMALHFRRSFDNLIRISSPHTKLINFSVMGEKSS